VLGATGPSAALGESGRSLLLRRSRTHDVVIVAEVALASVLLVGASLLAESLLRLTATPVGFDTRDLAVVTVRLPGGGAPVSRDELTARTDRGLERLAALPGVESVAGAATPPFAGSYGSNSIQIEGRAFERDPVANRQVVTEDYFRTMRIPVIEGRTFDVSDRPGANVAIVSTEFARRFLDGEAVGRRFTLNDVAHTIVGVAPNVKYREYTDADAASFYALQRQVGWPSTAFVVRTRGAAGDLLPAIRAAVLENEPGAAVSSIATMEALMRRSVAEERYRALLSSTFGVVALGLAAVGIYGLVTRRVIDRRHEIGLRMALGARPAEVQRLVLANAATLAGIGLAAGIPAAIAAAHVIAGFLYGVEPVSPHTFVLVAAVLGGGAVAAAILPARRASRVDPLVALRE
jgi:predicted permease